MENTFFWFLNNVFKLIEQIPIIMSSFIQVTYDICRKFTCVMCLCVCLHSHKSVPVGVCEDI